MIRVCIILVLTIYSVLVASSSTCSNAKYRLSGNVKPTFYSIKIQPDLDAEVFTGEVFMHITADVSVECIEFHLNHDYLNVETIFFDSRKVHHLSRSCFCSLYPDSYGYVNSEHEIITIVRGGGKIIPPGAHIIYVKYTGKFSKNSGLFKVGCSKNGSTLNYLLVTDFQPTHARKVFPCFDEPAFKAQFQLNVVVPNQTHVALSNMKAMQVFETSDGTMYKFETTPPMSPYLLSFAITEPSYAEYIDDNNKPFRLYAFNASSNNNTKLLEFSSQVISFYSNYTNFPYTLPKVDFIGFDRYESSATENWGLVTFNTSLLSPDNDLYDDSQKKSVIAHELAHFWFGNLVTNDWWDDIWLHESFATFMGIKAEEFILENQASKYFPTTYMENLFWLERTSTVTPVINFQEEPDEVRKNFNDITYNKGAAILRMLEVVLRDKLHEVLIQFVAKYAFKTATTVDFINIVMNVTSDASVREFMESYLYQSQFPVIFVEENESNYVLKQTRDGLNDSSVRWTIPITYITNSDKSIVWFYKDQERLTIPKNNATWIKLNYQQVGYYRVLYSDTLWETLITHYKELERYESNHLLLEAAGLFEMNLFSCEIVLKFLWELSNVTEDQSHFNMQIPFSVYVKINDIIKQHDKGASKLLMNFFGHVLLRAKKQRIAKRFLREVSPSDDGSNILEMGEIGNCINWLKNESYKYYANDADEDKRSTEFLENDMDSW